MASVIDSKTQLKNSKSTDSIDSNNVSFNDTYGGTMQNKLDNSFTNHQIIETRLLEKLCENTSIPVFLILNKNSTTKTAL